MMGTFSKIFGGGDKKLQKRADELLLDISKGLQSASAKLKVGAECWREGEIDTLKEIAEEVIELERDMDCKKEELIEEVLTKGAYLPQQTQERRRLINFMDSIIDAAEHAVRIMLMGCKSKPPEEIEDLAKKCWYCTDLLQDAIKYLFSDFKKSVSITRKVDEVREEARNIQFKLMGKLFAESKYSPAELLLFFEVSKRIVKVAVQAEDTGDYIRELAVKYS